MTTVRDLLATNAARAPGRPAFIEGGSDRMLTWADLCCGVAR